MYHVPFRASRIVQLNVLLLCDHRTSFVERGGIDCHDPGRARGEDTIVCVRRLVVDATIVPKEKRLVAKLSAALGCEILDSTAVPRPHVAATASCLLCGSNEVAVRDNSKYLEKRLPASFSGFVLRLIGLTDLERSAYSRFTMPRSHLSICRGTCEV